MESQIHFFHWRPSDVHIFGTNQSLAFTGRKLLEFLKKRQLSEGKQSKNCIRDAHTPQPGEIVFNTLRYRSSETVQRLGYFQSSVSYITVKMMFK